MPWRFGSSHPGLDLHVADTAAEPRREPLSATPGGGRLPAKGEIDFWPAKTMTELVTTVTGCIGNTARAIFFMLRDRCLWSETLERRSMLGRQGGNALNDGCGTMTKRKA